MSRNIGYDRNITIFSPEGKLFQIEYAFKAIRLPGDTSIGLRGTDTVCLITTKRVEDKLIDPSSVTRMFKISPNIGCLVTGRYPDGRGLIYKARSIAADFKFDNGFEIPVQYLAQEVANYNQMFTQHAYKRVPGVSMLFCGIDDETGPRLYMIDPAGACYGYKAVASGQKEQEAMSALEKLWKEKQEEATKDNKPFEMNYHQTVEASIESLQKVLGVDFKCNQVEVGVVTTKDSKFRILTEKEVDDFIRIISEKD